MAGYRLKTGRFGKKITDAYEKIEQKFVDTFLEEDADSEFGIRLKTGKTAEKVTEAYKSIEDSVVGTYQKIEDAFVDAFQLAAAQDETIKVILDSDRSDRHGRFIDADSSLQGTEMKCDSEKIETNIDIPRGIRFYESFLSGEQKNSQRRFGAGCFICSFKAGAVHVI